MEVWIGLIVFCVVFAASALHFWGIRRIGFLSEVKPVPSGLKLPFVSIIVAARNEQKNIEQALTSLLQIDYAAKEIIVVNDRSVDETEMILEGLQKKHPELRLLTVRNLPPGWLGKNHAHYKGALEARGELLLFTDADIVMAPSSLTKAVACFQAQDNEHLTILPEVHAPGILLRMVIVGFQVFFNWYTRPWSVRNPNSRAFIGIGAFNMMSRTAYERIGTHKAIRMRPDDDMQLGRLVKQRGLRQAFMFGRNMIQVEWYSSVSELINGLMKNSFSAVNYRLWVVVGGSVFVILFLIGPFIGAFVFTGAARVLFVMASLCLWICAVDGARSQNQSPWLAIGFPLAMVLMIYISWKAALRTLLRGGIEWRGTFYRLEELRGELSPSDHRE